ncbi:putative glutamine amidotransferase PB2B2.05 [Schizosaccharomyces pombe]
MSKPVVLLSVGYSNIVPLYIKAINKAGGIPIVVYPNFPISKIPAQINAVVLTGGESVHPRRYGEKFHQNVSISMDIERDEFEWAIVDLAMRRKLPILGICRGFQLINVYFGGSLCQKVSNAGYLDIHRPNLERDDLAHTVTAHSGQLLSILGSSPVFVNSIHDQGIQSLGLGLLPTVFAEDGLCEGLESEDGNIIGVQWHPEAIIDKQPHSLKLFQYFINRSKWHMKQSDIFSNVLPHESSFYRNSIISVPIAP